MVYYRFNYPKNAKHVHLNITLNYDLKEEFLSNLPIKDNQS